MIWFALILVALLVGVVVFVVLELQGGTRRTWKEAPDGPLTYRANFNSPLARIFYRLTTGRDGVKYGACFCFLGSVLVAGPSMSPKKAAHEIAGHLIRARRYGRWKYAGRYVTDGAFAKAEEVAAELAGDAHYLDPHFQTYGNLVAR
jgi:hypothetical protein